MIVSDLISLCKGMVISDARAIISIPTEVRLLSLLFLDVDCNDLDLVVGESDFNFKLSGHHEFISLNRVVVVLLLLNLLLVLEVAFLVDCGLYVIGVLHHLKRKKGLTESLGSLLELQLRLDGRGIHLLGLVRIE